MSVIAILGILLHLVLVFIIPFGTIVSLISQVVSTIFNTILFVSKFLFDLFLKYPRVPIGVIVVAGVCDYLII